MSDALTEIERLVYRPNISQKAQYAFLLELKFMFNKMLLFKVLCILLHEPIYINTP